MKFFLSPLFLLFLTTISSAETMQTRIYTIEKSENAQLPHLILLENGRVAKVDAADKSSLFFLEENRDRNELVEITVNRKNKLVAISTLADEAENLFLNRSRESDPQLQYTPTNLASLAEAQTIFNRFNRRHQGDSQCYNRAHVWAYEEWRRSNFQSVKLFMFFTKRYIWDYNYDWWFHVTPLTYVAGTPMTMDRTFNREPRTIKNWTLDFIHSRRDCPVVSKYSQYVNNQQTQHCYLIPATMYFWQPRDLDVYERTGVQKSSFINSEVNHAYLEAF